MKNIFEKKIILETSSYEFESFVNEIYNGKLSLSLIEGGDGDGTISEEVKKGDIHSYMHEKTLADEICSGKFENINGTHEVLLTLLRDGYIEEGEYIIHNIQHYTQRLCKRFAT